MATPVGARCDHCEEEFVAGDEGYLMPLARNEEQIIAAMNEDGVWDLVGKGVIFIAQHYECHMLGITGHARCILTHGNRGVCPPNEPRDPPNMSKRDAAKLAEKLHQERVAGKLTDQRKAILMQMLFPGEGRARRN